MNMNRKQKNYLIIGAVILMCIITAIVLVTRKDSTLEQNFHIKDVQYINRVVFEDKMNNKCELNKKSDSIWVVDDKSEASSMMVKTLLETLRDMRIREPISKAAHSNIIKQLSSRHTKVDVYKQSYLIDLGFLKLFKREKLEKTIFVGNETMDNMGTYMLVKGTENPCVIHIPNFRGYLSTRFSANADDWKAHTIFKYKPMDISSIKVELPQRPEENFEVYRDGETFHFKTLKDNAKLSSFDTIKVTALITSFFDLNYEGIARNINKLEKDTIFSKKPSFIFTIKNNSGKETKLRTFMKLEQPTWVSENDKDDFYEIFDVNRMYGIVDGNPDTLLLQYFALDNILRPASYYFDK